MKKILLLILVLTSLGFSLWGDWVTMYHKSTQNIDYVWYQCSYSSAAYGGGGFNISIYHKGFCPNIIYYNPTTGEWSKTTH